MLRVPGLAAAWCSVFWHTCRHDLMLHRVEQRCLAFVREMLVVSFCLASALCRQEEMLNRLHYLLYQSHMRYRPVLIGTASVQESEWVSATLRRWCASSSLQIRISAQHACLASCELPVAVTGQLP